MKALMDCLLLLALILVVLVLAGTAAPTPWDAHLGGTRLMLHMGASGGLVVGMPIVAMWFLRRNLKPQESTRSQRWGYWLCVLTGTATITTVFFCMLPYPSTDQMHVLMGAHGYAGFAMVPAVTLFALGIVRQRRIQSTRSATPG
jgi:heme/copper-type cytochrome/quinol oxidase subunit 2